MGFVFLLGPWLGVYAPRKELTRGRDRGEYIFSQVLAFRPPGYPLEVWAAWLGLIVSQWGLRPPRVDLHWPAGSTAEVKDLRSLFLLTEKLACPASQSVQA